jgi:hypothetical protein
MHNAPVHKYMHVCVHVYKETIDTPESYHCALQIGPNLNMVSISTRENVHTKRDHSFTNGILVKINYAAYINLL